MDKPISIILEDLKISLAKDINDAKLPLCLIEPIIKDLHEEISILAKQQLEKDKEEYEKQKDENKEVREVEE